MKHPRNVVIKDDLHKILKLQSAKTDKKIKQIVDEVLRERLTGQTTN